MQPDDMAPMTTDFDPAERDAVYRAIFTRRDIRSHFLDTPIPDEILTRLLLAAHHAPSVGFMQPWNFIVIRDPERKARMRDLVLKERGEELSHIEEARQPLYRSLKLEGIVEAPVNLCITCDRTRCDDSPLGRWHNPEMDLFSTVCAVQNLWLAARAEGIGVGWVSILAKKELRALLRIPVHIMPIAYLCLGYVSDFARKPELETKGWRQRLPLGDLIASETWAGAGEDRMKALAATFSAV